MTKMLCDAMLKYILQLLRFFIQINCNVTMESHHKRLFTPTLQFYKPLHFNPAELYDYCCNVFSNPQLLIDKNKNL